MDDFSDKWREEDGLLLLNGVRGLGPITLRRLLERFRGDPLSLLKASKRDLLQVRGVGKGVVDSIENAVNSDWLKKEKGKIKKHGVDFITKADFPPLLRELYDCPMGLYVLGALPAGPYVSIVGTRKPLQLHYVLLN